MENYLPTKEFIARKFALGQMLDIEINDSVKDRFQASLIGMREGKYLVTSLPSLTRHGNMRDLLMEKQEVIVRTICEKTTGECLGFKSNVYAKLKSPEQLLFLTFPINVTIHELRNEHRMLVNQKAQLFTAHGERRIFGILTDFSAGGCRFEYETAAETPPQKNDVVDICFQHPETGLDLRSSGRICSVRSFQNIVSVGMAFEKEPT